MSLLGSLKHHAYLRLFKRKWRKANCQNETFAGTTFPVERVHVGNYSYGPLNVYAWGAEEERLEIGSFVSIAPGVKFLLGGNHRVDTLLTFPVRVKFLGEKREASSKGAIIVEDDVWIGMDAMILSGSHIGRGAVVGARAVVAGEIPAYAIVVGNPAQIIGYRFEKETVATLRKIPFHDISKEFIINNRDIFLSKITSESVSRISQPLIAYCHQRGIDLTDR